MAIINGSFTGGSFAQYYSFYIEYFVAQNITNNTSTITVNTYIRKDKATQTAYGNNKTANQSVNGTNRSNTYSYDFRNSTLKLIQSEVYTVTHNADGTKSIYIGATTNGGTSLLGAASAGATVALPTIPRASTPTAYATTTGSNMQVMIAAASAAFRHEVVVAIGSYSKTVQAAAGATSVLVPTDMDWAHAIPNATSGTAAVTLRTYSGNTLIGTKTTTATLMVHSSILPTVSGTLTPQNLLEGYYVQGKSGVKVDLTGAGAYSSSIASYAGKVNNASYSGQSFTHTFIAAGVATITGTAKDTRGRSATWTDKSITVQPYAAPTIENLEVIRCNSDGTVNDDGDHIKARVVARTQVIGTPNVNTHEYWVIFQPSDGSPSVRVNLASTEAAIDITTAPQQVGKVTTYLVTAYVKDYYDTVSQYIEVPTVERILNFGADGESMAVGKIAERKGLEVAWDANFVGELTKNDKEVAIYDSGAWTPTLVNAGTVSYATRRGRWTRVGNKVEAMFWLSGTSTANNTDILNITGLIQSLFTPRSEYISMDYDLVGIGVLKVDGATGGTVRIESDRLQLMTRTDGSSRDISINGLRSKHLYGKTWYLKSAFWFEIV